MIKINKKNKVMPSKFIDMNDYFHVIVAENADINQFLHFNIAHLFCQNGQSICRSYRLIMYNIFLYLIPYYLKKKNYINVSNI